MKTLKFMLAAATAIGLASATQAAQNTEASTGFEKLARGTSVITGVTDNNANSYFYYAGATADDNESVIIAAPDMTGAQRPTGVSRFIDEDSRTNVLQVSTGTDPLLRTFAPLSGSAPQAADTFTDPVYVDTLVQFTVTPYTDNVTPGSSDKLMIYLKEMTNDVGTVTGTNLVVVGGYLTGSSTVSHEYVLNTGSVTVNPNEWHRLTVKAVADLVVVENEGAGFPGFQIWVDGTLCTLSGAQTYDENAELAELFVVCDLAQDINAGKYVLSLLAAGGGQSATLQAVGFAGEGYVDDLVVTTTDPFNANIVDFTFARTEGVGSVEFTINSGAAKTQDDTYEVSIGDTIVVTATAATGYELIAPTFSGLTADPGNTYASATYTVTGRASLTINAQEAAAPSDWAADPTQIEDNTPAATQYPALADSALATADAKKLTVWATDNNIDFSAIEGDTEGTYVEAYLLDCAVGEVEDEKDDFTLTITFDSEGNPVIESPVDRGEKTYNGTVIIKGSTTVNGTYENPAPSGAKFFKAELSL